MPKYPKDEVRSLYDQLIEIQKEQQSEPELSHEGKTAQDYYAERLAMINLVDGEVKDGKTIVNGLLTRCLLWVEVIEEKYGIQQIVFVAHADLGFFQARQNRRTLPRYLRQASQDSQ